MWLAIAAPLATAAPVDHAYLAELVERSRALGLAERPEWHKLLHYVPNLGFPGVHSLVDSPGFFNAQDGKTNPQGELAATLAAFYQDETPERQSAQCTFIARRAWLDEQLKFDRARLPRITCLRYEEWYQALNPKGLTLVFASAYVDNPASMYGHTLLRVDARDQDEHTRLLAYSVNFGANTDETNGLVFAVKGLLGGYPGAFSILPYYLKVREYSDLENRDLWEYELSLSAEEVDRVVRHIWEILPAYWEYYFFDENCSYHLLRVIQVARPELDLAARFRWWALPTDTVRAVTEQPSLLAKALYRPASATVIAQRLRGMSAAEKGITKDLSLRQLSATSPEVSVLPAARAAAVLETAHAYVEYRRASGKQDIPEPRGLARELLLARSRLDAITEPPRVPAPRTRPDEGHASSRIGIGGGRYVDRDFYELQWRPAYHDVLDTDGGFVRGAEVEFFAIKLRRYTEDDHSEIESFVPLSIASLAPRDEFFESWSWRVSAGWRRTHANTGRRPLATTFDGGFGKTWGSLGRMAYAMMDVDLRFHSDFEDSYAFGAGPSIGLLLDVTTRIRVHGYARVLRQFIGENDTPGSIGLESRFSLGRDLALRFDIARQREAGRSFDYGSLSLMVYH